MATLTSQTIVESGLNTTYAAAGAGGDTFLNDTSEKIFLHVKNGDASSKTVTVTAAKTSATVPGMGPMTKGNISIAIPAGDSRMIGPLYYTAYGKNPAITYSAVTSVTVAVVRI